MELDKLKQSVVDLLNDGKISDALNLINENDSSFEDSNTNKVIQLTMRFSALNRDNHMGLMTTDQLNTMRNQIINSILEICDIDARSVRIGTNAKEESYSADSEKGVSFKEIKSVLKGIKNNENKIDYYEAIDALSDLY